MARAEIPSLYELAESEDRNFRDPGFQKHYVEVLIQARGGEGGKMCDGFGIKCLYETHFVNAREGQNTKICGPRLVLGNFSGWAYACERGYVWGTLPQCPVEKAIMLGEDLNKITDALARAKEVHPEVT